MKKLLLFTIISNSFIIVFYAQEKHKIDSLQQQLPKLKNDSEKINILNSLSYFYSEKETAKALQYANEGLCLSEKTSFIHGLASGYKIVGDIWLKRCDYLLALNNFQKSLKYYLVLKDDKNVALCYTCLGDVYKAECNYIKALECYQSSLIISEKSGDKRGTSKSYLSIGVIHRRLNNHQTAIDYYQKSLKIAKEMGDREYIAKCYNNIGVVYRTLGDYRKALQYYQLSLKMKIMIKDYKGSALDFNNIGIVYSNYKDYNKAIENYNKSLEIMNELGDKEGKAMIYGNISCLDKDFKKFNEAIEYAKKSMLIAKEIGAVDDEELAHLYLSESYSGTNNYKLAYEHFKIYNALNDSILNIEKQKDLTKMEAVYQSEKKQKEIDILEKDKRLKTDQLHIQKLEKYAFIGGFICMCIIVVLLLFSFNKIRFQKLVIEEKNEELNAQNEEIVVQRDMLYGQKKGITDSIEYASIIQKALLSSTDELNNCNLQNFILYKPLDRISGDFYWFKKIQNYLYFTAADCTGHGVPGAFMSVLGISKLTEIIHANEIIPPSEVLFELRQMLKEVLRQNSGKSMSQDGMDIALCLLNLDTNYLQYAGAFNPLFVYRNSELIELEADRMPVGVHPKDQLHFTNREIQLQPGDSLYIFSDGYLSQFGGELGKKFTYNRFKELLREIHQMPVDFQKQILEKRLVEWQRDHIQIDDIVIFGMRV